MQVWCNGRLLGRYHLEGPQDRFYLPEDYLKPKNRLVLFSNAHEAPVIIGEAEISPYFTAKEGTVRIRL